MTRLRFWLTVVFSVGLCVVSVPPVSHAGEFHNALSLQGYTGLLNTPNAEVTETGRLDILYSNQKEPQWRNQNYEDNVFATLGIFPNMELGGRLTAIPGE